MEAYAIAVIATLAGSFGSFAFVLLRNRRRATGLASGCRTNQRRLRLLVRLPQGHEFAAQHFGRGEAAPAGWAALTRSAEMAVVKFV